MKARTKKRLLAKRQHNRARWVTQGQWMDEALKRLLASEQGRKVSLGAATEALWVGYCEKFSRPVRGQESLSPMGRTAYGIICEDVEEVA